ncbi:MAG: endonuclease [Flavobacteriaceae bacterium]|nr:MAG: endonuclease [Flavobacteriaceae bacterium]
MKAFLRAKKTFYLKLVKKIDLMKVRSIIIKFLALTITFLAILLLIACIVPYIPVKRVPSLSILSLVFPVLVMINLVILVFCFFLSKKHLVVPLFALVVAFLTLGSFYKINFLEKAPVVEEGFEIMSFNVRSFNSYSSLNDTSIGDKIIAFLKDETPDILCLQEHNRTWGKQLKNYPYKAESPYPKKLKRSTQVIFSKYPIISNGSLDFPNTANNCIYADILYKNDTIRVYNMHLQSYKVRSVSRETSNKLLGKFNNAIKKQEEQAQLFLKHAKTSHFKTIVCADFNNSQFSRTYRMVKGDMKDTYQEKGVGFGMTYEKMKFPFRIDYILVDNSFNVMSHKNYKIKLSDHYPITSTLDLKD